MSTIAQRIDDDQVLASRAPVGATRVIAVLVALLALVLAFAGAKGHDDALAWSGGAVIAAWGVATVVVALNRPHEPLGLWLASTTLAGAAALTNDHLVGVVPYALALTA